jgi:hypothetical protein
VDLDIRLIGFSSDPDSGGDGVVSGGVEYMGDGG